MAKGWGALAAWAPFFDDANAAKTGWGPDSSGIAGPQGPQGVQGPAGPQGNPGADGAAGPAGLNWKGAWSNVTAYVANDSVGRNGASWFATGNTTGTDPNPSGDGHTAQAPWQLLAAQGATGPAGPQGPAGAQGPQGPQGPAGGGALTIQSNTLGADVNVGAGAATAIFSDAFTAGTWDIDCQFFLSASGAAAQCAIDVTAGTATITSRTPPEIDFITSTVAAYSVRFVTRVVLSVGGTVNIRLNNITAGAITVKGPAGLTAYHATKVA